MAELRELQENFQNYILNNDQSVIGQIRDMDDMTGAERAALYKEGYALRLIEITGKDFPHLKTFMGEAAFDELAFAYLQAHPSNHFNVMYFDRYFTQFLAQLETAEPVQIELARYEWEIAQTLITADAPQLTVEDLGAVPPEQWGDMTLSFHPSAHLFSMHSNAPAIWAALCDGSEPPEFEAFDQPATWMMWRFNQLVYFIELNDARTWMYNALVDGKTFGDICEGLMDFMSEEEVAQFACLSLRDWFLEGAISEIGGINGGA